MNPAVFQFSFSHITIFPFLFIPSVAPPCVVQGAKLRTGPLKICKAASRPAGFGENFSIRPAGRLKIFHQKPCIFSPRPYLPPETSKVKPPTRHKKKVNVMKKRIEIQQDLKRGFGSAPTGIKNLVKWSPVGFVVYVAVRFVCAFLGGVAIGCPAEQHQAIRQPRRQNPDKRFLHRKRHAD